MTIKGNVYIKGDVIEDGGQKIVNQNFGTIIYQGSGHQEKTEAVIVSDSQPMPDFEEPVNKDTQLKEYLLRLEVLCAVAYKDCFRNIIADLTDDNDIKDWLVWTKAGAEFRDFNKHRVMKLAIYLRSNNILKDTSNKEICECLEPKANAGNYIKSITNATKYEAEISKKVMAILERFRP